MGVFNYIVISVFVIGIIFNIATILREEDKSGYKVRYYVLLTLVFIVAILNRLKTIL